MMAVVVEFALGRRGNTETTEEDALPYALRFQLCVPGDGIEKLTGGGTGAALVYSRFAT
jgi:hypothetical protein